MENFDFKLGKECENFQKHFTPTYILKYDFENSKDKMIQHIQDKGVENFIMKSFLEGGLGDIHFGNEILEFI